MSLTGGTGDVNPQLLSFLVTESAADTTTTQQQTLPVEKFGSSRSGKARIIEVLKVYFVPGGVSTEVDSNFSVHLSTTSFAATATAFNEPRVFASMIERRLLTTSGTFTLTYPYVMDLTDSTGHGVLIATDSIFAQLSSTTTGIAISCSIKILYRFKQVNITEYVGIVQSQS